MMKPHAFGLRDGAERADLIEDEIENLLRLGVDFAAAEAHQIWKAGMRADGHAGARSQTNRRAHHRRIAGVKSACDAAGGDAAQQQLVVAHLIQAERLSDVSVEIDPQGASSRRILLQVASRPAPAHRSHPSVPVNPYERRTDRESARRSV